MALEGTFKDFGLADIFQLIGLQKKTGVLTMRGEDVKTITSKDAAMLHELTAALRAAITQRGDANK